MFIAWSDQDNKLSLRSSPNHYQFLSKMRLTIFSPKRSSWVSYAHHLFHCPYIGSQFFFMYVLYSQQGERIHSPFPFLNCLNSVKSWILKTSRELFGVTKSQFLKRVTGLDVYESCIIFLWLLFLHLLAKGQCSPGISLWASGFLTVSSLGDFSHVDTFCCHLCSDQFSTSLHWATNPGA